MDGISQGLVCSWRDGCTMRDFRSWLIRRIGKFVSFWLIHFKFGSICLISWIGELVSSFLWYGGDLARVGMGGERGREGRENKESRSLCVITLLWRQQNIAAEGGEVVSAYIHSIWRKWLQWAKRTTRAIADKPRTVRSSKLEGSEGVCKELQGVF